MSNNNGSKTSKMKYTRETFIKNAKEIHGQRYDYSKVEYINSYTDVIIICKEHGEFNQLPYNHTNSKSNCPKCNKRRFTTESFIERAIAIHGDEYNYSKTNYINSTTKVTIICKKHGEFKQLPIDCINKLISN